MLEPWSINVGTLAYQCWNPGLSMLEPWPINVGTLAYQCWNTGLSQIIKMGTSYKQLTIMATVVSIEHVQFYLHWKDMINVLINYSYIFLHIIIP